MDVGVLIYVCGVILSATLVLDPIARALSYDSAKLAMFCLTSILMGMFELRFTPELSINPATLIVLLYLIVSAVKRAELKLIPFFACIPILTSLILLTALYTDANPYYTALISSLSVVICGISRPSLSMLSASCASLFAYYLSVVISTCMPSGVYAVFESHDLYNTQAISFLYLFLIHGAYALLKTRSKKQVI